MASGQLRSVINQLRRLIGRDSGCTLTDAQLIEDFVVRRDEASFEVLVWRHGTMVLNLCQRVLRDSHEAEDAFQATFLVFARKAGSIGKSEAVGCWLYKVAYRVALRVRARAARRNGQEEPVAELPGRESMDEVEWRDLRPVLDEEIDRLPEKYRAPFVLCYLEGQTNEEAAAQLGCPKGTILSRLSRGRERLRARLARRGLALSAAGLGTVLSQSAAAAPAALVNATVEAAIPFAAGQAAVGLVSASVAALTEGVLQAMFLTKVKFAAAALLTLAVLAPGAGLVTHMALAERPAAEPRKPAVERGGERRPAAPEEKLTSFAGKVVALAADGKTVTLEIATRDRGAAPQRQEFKIDDKTAIAFSMVGPDGAKLAEGQMTNLFTKEGANELAVRIQVMGAAKDLYRRAPDVYGRVTKVSPDAKVVTFHFGGRGRGENAVPEKDVDVRIGDKTTVLYSFVTGGATKPTEGYDAEVWLERGSTDMAERINFGGSEPRPPRVVVENEPQPVGRVVAAAADGKSFTVEAAPKARGEGPSKVEIKIDDKTKVVYRNVGADGAKPVEGHQVRVWLVDGSKDTAFKVEFFGPEPKSRHNIIQGRVAGIAADGKGISVEGRPDGRGEVAKKVDIKLTDKTNVIYHGVGPGGAKLTEGYFVQVYLEDGSTDTAAQVGLAGSLGRR